MEPDEQAAIRFQIEFLRQTGRRFERAIEYRCGPTLMRALAAAHYVDQIDMADWHAGNLERIQRWQGHAPDAVDWSSFARYAFSVEGTTERVEELEGRTRRVIGQLLLTDARLENPLGAANRGSNDLLVSGFGQST